MFEFASVPFGAFAMLVVMFGIAITTAGFTGITAIHFIAWVYDTFFKKGRQLHSA